MSKLLSKVPYLLLLGPILHAQTGPHGLRPGTSSRQDVQAVYGQPASEVSKTLVEYRSDQPGELIFAQYRSNSGVLERLEVVYATPRERGQALQDLALPKQPSASKINDLGRREEYFSRQLVVLTYSDDGLSGAVSRVGYYSRELFDSTVPMAHPQPQQGGSTGMSAASPMGSPAPQQSGSVGMTAASEVLTPVGSNRAHNFGLRLLTPINSESSKAGDVIRAEVISPDTAKGSEVAGAIRWVSCTGSGVYAKCVLRFSFDTMTYSGQLIPVVGLIVKLTNSKGWPHVDEEGDVVGRGGNWIEAIIKPVNATLFNGTPLGPHPEVFIELSVNRPKLSFDTGSQFTVGLESDLAQRGGR